MTMNPVIISQQSYYTYFLHKGSHLAKLLQHWFMSDSTNILDVVVYLSLFVLWGAPSRFTRIDTFEDTETAKVLESNLKSLEAGGSSDKGSINATMILFAHLSHARQLALAAHARVGRRLVRLLLWTSLHSITHDGRLQVHLSTVLVGQRATQLVVFESQRTM